MHFVGLATSDCLFNSSPRPSCTADSRCCPESHSTSCSAILSTCLAMFCTSATSHSPSFFCAHLTFHILLSCPISHFHPRFPYAFLTVLCPFWHMCCLDSVNDTGFQCLSLLRLESPHSVLPKQPKSTPFRHCNLFVACPVQISKLIKSTYQQQNQLSNHIEIA
jgi:hypothetical protein